MIITLPDAILAELTKITACFQHWEGTGKSIGWA